MDWRKPQYLLEGTTSQKTAYSCLISLSILDNLGQWDPVLTGTIPIDVDIESSDLDIICHVTDPEEFTKVITEMYGNKSAFCVREKGDVRIVRFHSTFPVEIFAAPIPVDDQLAFRHMKIEYRIITLGGDDLKATIRRLKREGHNTEQAFCLVLGIPGDPFTSLLKVETMDDKKIKSLLENSNFR